MGSMKKKSNTIKQRKIKHYILTPVRILKRAKELYVKGMMACSGKFTAGSAISVSHLPPVVDHSNQSVVNNNVNTSKINGSERQSLREIFITAPINEMRLVTNGEQKVATIRNNNIVGSESVVVMQRRQRQRNAGYKYNRNKMSYQTEVRKMGRIDEDKPCYFEEDESDHSISKANLLYLYPRSSRINTVVKKPHEKVAPV